MKVLKAKCAAVHERDSNQFEMQLLLNYKLIYPSSNLVTFPRIPSYFIYFFFARSKLSATKKVKL